jgi:diguanylate cyclase (GGDEF)-like protein
MNPPIFYILIVLVLTSGMISLIFFIAWKNFVREPHTLSWAAAFFCAMCQWICTLARPWFPSFELYWLIVNGLALCLITLGLRGHIERTQADWLPKNLWPYTALAFAGIAWTSLVDPHVGISTAIVPLAAAVTLFLSSWIVMKHRAAARPQAEVAVVMAMFVFGIVQVIAAWLALLQGSSGDSDYRLVYFEFNFMTLPAGYIGIAMFTIFMLASDMSEQVKKIAVMDPLTGLLNRRGFGEQAPKAFATARRAELPLSLVMSDIDRFKDINDDFGHAVGDLALQHFSAMLQQRRRAEDIVARMGGEEFALVLPGTGLADAIALAESLCARIEDNPMEIDGRPISMTASFGVSTISERDTCVADIVVRADRALYRSKRSGRNRVDIESSQRLDPARAMSPAVSE